MDLAAWKVEGLVLRTRLGEGEVVRMCRGDCSLSGAGLRPPPRRIGESQARPGIEFSELMAWEGSALSLGRSERNIVCQKHACRHKSINEGTYGTIEGLHITEEHAADVERPAIFCVVRDIHAEGQAPVYEAGVRGEVL
jgi:hypothetical protein